MSLITKLEPGEIFVFGSNHRGRHGAGAALYAAQHFRAEEGRWFGPTGLCFAIPTKDANLQTLPLVSIWQYVDQFLGYAERKHYYGVRFLVTTIGCGLAGYQPRDIARMFAGAPENVVLPPEFTEALR